MVKAFATYRSYFLFALILGTAALLLLSAQPTVLAHIFPPPDIWEVAHIFPPPDIWEVAHIFPPPDIWEVAHIFPPPDIWEVA